MDTGMKMILKKNLLWILLFGTFIGLNETLIGSFSFPYRSVVLSAIALALLAVARFKIPQKGTSLLIMGIAILFKLNNLGIHACTPNVLLCGPTALLMLGVSFEIFAGLFIKNPSSTYLKFSLTCLATAILAFSLFGLMNTYILDSWNPERLIIYILIKSPLAGLASSVLALIGIFSIKTIKNRNWGIVNPYIINSLVGFVVLALWLLGSFMKF